MQNQAGGTDQQLVDEIECLRPESDTLMDEIDQMDQSVEMKTVNTPLGGPAAKYEIPADPGDGTVAQGAGSSVSETGASQPDDKATSAAADTDAAEEHEQGKDQPKVYAEISCFCIPRSSAIRRNLQPILDHPRFDQISLSVIGLNCLTLALFDPLDPECKSTKCQVVSALELCWTIFFTVEFLFKWLVMGFTGEGGYWSDGWNRLDGIIVFFGLFDLVGAMAGGVEIPGTSALRTLRAIRPLRALNKFPSLRILVNLLCETLPQMASVGILCFFVFFVFGILAVQLWNGLFRQRCYTPDGKSMFGDMNDDPYICTITSDQQNGMAGCPASYQTFGLEALPFTSCQRKGDNPHFGAIHFDNIFGAWVAIFQCITLEAWVDIMYYVQDGYGFWSWIYFVALIIVGAWFMVNLTLVVIAAQFGSTKGEQMEQMKEQVLQERLERERQERLDIRRIKKGWIQKIRDKAGCAAPLSEKHKERARKVEEIEAMEVEMNSLKDPEAQAKIEATIEREESFLQTIDYQMAENDEAAAAGMFTYIDTNKDGFLDLDEFKSQVTACFSIEASEADALFADMDSNKDSRLSREEFITGYVDFKTSRRNACVRWRMKLRRTVLSDDFSNMIMGCIAVNVVFMAIEHYDQPDALTTTTDIANFFFCMVFALEMLLKLIAIGPIEYVSDGFNVFDGVIVIISLVELAGGGGGLSVLRTFRLVRVFRLISFLPTLQKQISVMIQTLGEVGSFLLILGLFIFIISIVGMFIFGGRFAWDGDGKACDVKKDYADLGFKWRDGCTPDRKNFDTFFWALITVFQTLTQEDWNAGMYNGVRALGFPACIYFLFLIVFGNYILFNLFVAILIDGFAAEPDEEEQEEEEEGALNKSADNQAIEGSGTKAVEGSGVGCGGGVTVRANPLVGRRQRVIDAVLPGLVPSNRAIRARWSWGSGRSGVIEERYCRHTEGPLSASSQEVGRGSGVGEEKGDLIHAADTVTTISPIDNIDDIPDDHVKPGDENQPAAQQDENNQTQQAEELPEVFSNAQGDLSWWCLKPDNAFRLFCAEWVDDSTSSGKRFDRFIMGTIMFNSITLAMERCDIKDGSPERIFLFTAGNLFGFIFLVEMLMKVTAWNFMSGPTEVKRKFKGPARYWDEGWNKLDGTLVIISVIDVVMSNIPGLDAGSIAGLLKIFRILRALRPLRAVNKLPGLKLVVNCLLASLAPIGTTLIIVFTIFFIFGILGTQLFNGKMWYCDVGDDFEAHPNRPLLTKNDCVNYYNQTWVRHYYNFDHLGQSLLTLFVLSSIDGWVDIMYQGIDGVNSNGQMQPQENHSEAMALFFVAFLLLGGFLILNMFVGVILENFNAAQEAEEQRQKEAIARGELVVEPPKEAPPDPLNGDYYKDYPPFRLSVYHHVKNDRFDAIIGVAIMSNVTVMAMEHYDPSDGFKVFLKVQNYFFSLVFLYECIVKNIAFGKLYYGDNWCRFDFFIVLISIVDVILDVVDADLPVNPTILRVMRVMRIARILRLVKGKWAEDLRKLLVTVAASLGQAGNLGLLMFLLYFICACLGIELFGCAACTASNPCEGMNDKANFKHFWMALLTLFRLSTGDNWNGILKDALRAGPTIDGCDYSVDCKTNCCDGCNADPKCRENCCSDSVISIIYFIFFILSAQFVMLNLVVAVLMKELDSAATADAEEQAQLDAQLSSGAVIAEETSVEVLRESQAGDEVERRDSFQLQQDKKHWMRRQSGTHRPGSRANAGHNVMFNFPDDDGGKGLDTIDADDDTGKGVSTTLAANEDVADAEKSDGQPIQTGQTNMAPATPPAILDSIEEELETEVPERPPTRSAWENQ